MADTLTFELVSPERLLVSEQAEMVVLPGVEGDFGVLPLHAPFTSMLRPGTITTYEGTNVDKRIFVGGGFAEVNEKSCTVLAEDAVPLSEIDRGEAERALRDAREDLADAKEPSETELAKLERQITVAEARLEALQAATAGN